MKLHLEKNRSIQKSIFIRKHMLTAEKHYDKKVKIIEHEVDIASAYPSRLHCLTNNKLIEILGKDSKLLKMILSF